MDVRAELISRCGRGVGIQLNELLLSQGSEEYYTEDHFVRVVQYEADFLDRPPRDLRCIDVHGSACQYDCKSCHSCRQKTVGRKTECRCGRGTGIWCGNCLNTRMGQNIEEVFLNPNWRCPSCLQICNCSGRSCDRHTAGLGNTNMLSAEARSQGYMSTAHYLIQTHLERKLGIAPSLTAGPYALGRRKRRQPPRPAADAQPEQKKCKHTSRPSARRALKDCVAEEFALLDDPAANSIEVAALQMEAAWTHLDSSEPRSISCRDPPAVRPVNQTRIHEWFPGNPPPIQRQEPPVAPFPINHMEPRAFSGTTTMPLRENPTPRVPRRDTREHCFNEGSHSLYRGALPTSGRRANIHAPSPSEADICYHPLDGPHPGLPGVDMPKAVRAYSRAPHPQRSQQTAKMAAAPPESTEPMHFQGREASVRPPQTQEPTVQQVLSGEPSASQGLMGSALTFAQQCAAAGYERGSEEHQVYEEGLVKLLNDLQDHLTEPVPISAYNKELQEALRSDMQPEHCLVDYAALKDACRFLLLAAEVLDDPAEKDNIMRLLFCVVPFADFTTSDPRARAILLQAAFRLFDILKADTNLANSVVTYTLEFMEVLVSEYEALQSCSILDGVEIGPILSPKMRLAAQQTQLQEDISAVTEADDLLIRLFLRHVQKACHRLEPASLAFLNPKLLALVGNRKVSEEVRLQVCHLITFLLAAVSPDQEVQLGSTAFKEKQGSVLQVLLNAKTDIMLEGLMVRSKPACFEELTRKLMSLGRAQDAAALEELHTCQKVAAIQDKLLARLLGVRIAANELSWEDLLKTILSLVGRTNFVVFMSEATLAEMRSACIFLIVATQAAPKSDTSSRIWMMKCWLCQAFDHTETGRRIFAAFTKALAATDSWKHLFLELDEPGLLFEDDASGESRASVIQQVLLKFREVPQKLRMLLGGIPKFVASVDRSISQQQDQTMFEAASTRVLLAMCRAEHQVQRWQERAYEVLGMVATWMRKASSRCMHLSQDLLREGVAMGVPQGRAPTPEAVQSERRAMMGTCLGSLGEAFLLLDSIFCSIKLADWDTSEPPIRLLRELLAPGLELASGKYLTHAEWTKPSSGNTYDVNISAMTASALAQCSNEMIHFILRNNICFLLRRPVRHAINALRFIADLLQHPTVRHSKAKMTLLLPCLLKALMDALCPTEENPSTRVQEAVVTFLVHLMGAGGGVVLPELHILPIPEFRGEVDWAFLKRAIAPEEARFEPAMQSVAVLVCRYLLNCLSGALKGRLKRSTSLGVARLPPTGALPVISVLDQKEALVYKEVLTKMLGRGRCQLRTETAYSNLHALRLEEPPPDFYLRLSERALLLLEALACAEPHGMQWAMATAGAIRPLLAPPQGNSILREKYNSIVIELGTTDLSIPGSLPAAERPDVAPQARVMRTAERDLSSTQPRETQ